MANEVRDNLNSNEEPEVYVNAHLKKEDDPNYYMPGTTRIARPYWVDEVKDEDKSNA